MASSNAGIWLRPRVAQRFTFNTCFKPYLAMIICHAGTKKYNIFGKKYLNIGVSNSVLPLSIYIKAKRAG
jgi:hypothetical protein